MKKPSSHTILRLLGLAAAVALIVVAIVLMQGKQTEVSYKSEEYSHSLGLGLILEDQDGAVYVSAVRENCPAANAGIQPGDVLTRINDTSITSRDDLDRFLSQLNWKDGLTMEGLRDGETVSFTFQPRSDHKSSEDSL